MGENFIKRERTLTDADLEALSDHLQCTKCAFTNEEVIFVKDWLDTAKTAKSEVIKWVIKGIIILIGLVAGLQVAIKMGFGKGVGK
jgi:hypothetical protein